MSAIGKTSAFGIAVDAHSSANKFRSTRFAMFRSMVDQILAENGKCSILDIGGTQKYWNAFGANMPAAVQVTVTNLFDEIPPDTETIRFERVDACNMPYNDNSFDIIHSNSVIEHVGLFYKQVEMANEIRRVAPRYFVQTPNYWFPIEPHCRTPFFHWLPEPTRASMLLRKDRGFWKKAENIGKATEQLQGAILLDERQMRFLFPGAELHREKFYGLTKSIVAIKR